MLGFTSAGVNIFNPSRTESRIGYADPMFVNYKRWGLIRCGQCNRRQLGSSETSRKSIYVSNSSKWLFKEGILAISRLDVSSLAPEISPDFGEDGVPLVQSSGARPC